MDKQAWCEWVVRFGYANLDNPGFLDALNAASRAIYSTIKSRSPYVSLHTAEELQRLRVPSRPVFKVTAVATPKPL